ncbi:MAG TPA: tRNA 2-thiouridine(34) synthase MnmA [Chloroflexi bacterium]|nr:tRNA 2-thiouridine(34) synthase MnmA [Chloroflexota bacterium]
MSGGVDSSVAAALLVRQGHQVIGMMLRLWSEADNGQGPANRCCTLDAQYVAQRVADILEIPFHLVNVAERFRREVVAYFIAEYAAGRTPNPCILCNQRIRFGWLLNRALALGADYLATGHYARIRHEGGTYRLLRGVDRPKDQSYALYRLDQHALAHTLFPVGSYTKARVRQMAREMGLPVAERAESQDLCFVADGDYRRFLQRQAPETIRPGPIRDLTGRVLGEHRGLPFYTVGQRKGLGLTARPGRPGEAPQPLYVVALDPAENALIVGPAEALRRRTCRATQVHWIRGQAPEASFRAQAQIRYRAPETPVTVIPFPDGDVEVRFDEPQRGVTPGQSIVFYRDDEVLGGGIITR